MCHYHMIPGDKIRVCEDYCYVEYGTNVGLVWDERDVKRNDLEKLFLEKLNELDKLGIPYSQYNRNLASVVLHYDYEQEQALAQKD